MMTISANGSTTGSGVLWAAVPRNGDASVVVAPGSLYAFNAETLALLWASTGVGDDTYSFSKGSIPMVANGKVYLGSDSALVNVYGNRTVVPPSQNLALNKVATGSTPCIASQGPAEAVNGSYSEGLNDKFCSAVSDAWLEVDLGAPYTVSRFIVEHAGAGGETLADNTVAFNIQVSTDNVNFTTVVNVTNNTLSITTNDITPVTARYVRLNVTTPTSDGDPATRIYEFQVFNADSYGPEGFSLSATPPSQSVTPGSGASYTATTSATNGFDGTVTFSASGAPSGATVAFSPSTVTGSGSSLMTVSTSNSTPPGTYTLTITGASGASLQHTATVSLTVTGGAASKGFISVPLSSAASRIGFVTDGSTFHGGLDGYGFAYSANLLGTTQSYDGATFTLGPPNVANVVSNATVALPAGQFTTLNLLATGVNGDQPSQTFTVTYTDGTKSAFTQSLSDWFTPQGYAGETTQLAMAYRDVWNGSENTGTTLYVYAYSFALNSSKTVSSITLPANSNVVVLAMTLVSVPVPVPLSSAYNLLGIVTDGSTFNGGGIDGYGWAYSANLLGTTQTFNGSTFNIGPPNALNVVTKATVALPAGQYTTLNLLGTGVNGLQASQTFTVTYTDGTTSTFTQSLSDWYTYSAFSGESIVLAMAYRDRYNGTEAVATFHVYGYSFALNPAKTVSSIALPANSNVVVVAIALNP
jgi:hypothetical protein